MVKRRCDLGPAIDALSHAVPPGLHGWVPQLASLPPKTATGATWLPSDHIV